MKNCNRVIPTHERFSTPVGGGRVVKKYISALCMYKQWGTKGRHYGVYNDMEKMKEGTT